MGKKVGADVLMGVVVEVVVVDFCHFLALLFGGYHGCETGDGGCGWCSSVGWSCGLGVKEMVYGLRLGVGVGGVRNGGEAVVTSGGNVNVADGGGARWRYSCRFPDGFC